MTARWLVAIVLAAGCGDASSSADPSAAAPVPLRARPGEVTEITLKALGVT